MCCAHAFFLFLLRPESLARYFRQLDGEGGVDIDPDEEERAHLGEGDEEEEASIMILVC